MNDKPDYKKIITEKLKNPQWRVAIAIILTTVFLLFWSRVSQDVGPKQYDISYSQFIEHLNANNIYSVTIKGLHIKGEFKKDVNIYLLVEKAVPALGTHLAAAELFLDILEQFGSSSGSQRKGSLLEDMLLVQTY